MPVTTTPAAHQAAIWGTSNYRSPLSAVSEVNLLEISCREEYKKYFNRSIATSFSGLVKEDNVYGFQNGFVAGSVEAYSKHHHLTIRPEDVWFSILSQLSFYINANAEELRDKFVAHEGQKELVALQMATLKTADYGKLAFDMGKIIQKNVIDPELREWMMPAFTTTTKTDEVVASVMMMGSMQQYFKYVFSLKCGLPSVTLLGECSDWEKILSRLEKLLTLGKEPSLWHTLLKPVISRFVQTFKSPDSSATKDFWQKIAHHSGGGSGPTYLSGWITAFCFWDEKGRTLHVPGRNPPSSSVTETFGRSSFRGSAPELKLDGVKYHKVDTQDIAPGWVSVPVKVDDNGTIHDTRMAAGSVGVKVTSSEKGDVLDTVQPVSGWWIFESKSEEELRLHDETRKRWG